MQTKEAPDRNSREARADSDRTAEGSRAILRVPEILMAVADGSGPSFADLRARLGLPKSSLHRLLRTLEQGGYLIERSGSYELGVAASRLSHKLANSLAKPEFSRSVRPVLEWLARESHESVMLASISDGGDEVVYVDVINSASPLRVTVPPQQRRPFYAAASGQVFLAYLPREQRDYYFAHVEFARLTNDTIARDELAGRLDDIRRRGVNFDRNGSFIGASAVASPCFDDAGRVRYAVSIAGPTDRMEPMLDQLCRLSLEAGERISQMLGYTGPYPPASIDGSVA